MATKRKIDSTGNPEPNRGTAKKAALGQKLVDWKMMVLRVTKPKEDPQFVANLKKIGLDGLLKYPWVIKMGTIIQDLYNPLEHYPKDSARGNKSIFGPAQLQEVYGFAPGGEPVLNRSGKEWEPYFDNRDCDPHTGWKVEHCKDPELKALLQFVVPILSPIGPQRVTKQLVSTIVLSWKQERQIDWSSFFMQNIAKMIKALDPEKSTRICPFVAHLYKHYEVLTPAENSIWERGEISWKLDLLEAQDEDESLEEECSKSADPKVELVSTVVASPSIVGLRSKRLPAMAGNSTFVEAFASLQRNLQSMANEYVSSETIVESIAQIMKCDKSELTKKIASLSKWKYLSDEVESLRTEKKVWTNDRSKFENKILKAAKDLEHVTAQVPETLKCQAELTEITDRLSTFVSLPVEDVIKHWMYDAMVRDKVEPSNLPKMVQLFQFYTDKVRDSVKELTTLDKNLLQLKRFFMLRDDSRERVRTAPTFAYASTMEGLPLLSYVVSKDARDRL